VTERKDKERARETSASGCVSGVNRLMRDNVKRRVRRYTPITEYVTTADDVYYCHPMSMSLRHDVYLSPPDAAEAATTSRSPIRH